ncbi:MAG TPA: hypothetical protein VGL05_11340 [Kribbella sp.]
MPDPLDAAHTSAEQLVVRREREHLHRLRLQVRGIEPLADHRRPGLVELDQPVDDALLEGRVRAGAQFKGVHATTVTSRAAPGKGFG